MVRDLTPLRWPDVFQDYRTSLIGHIYLFQKHFPYAESRRLVEYFAHYHPNFVLSGRPSAESSTLILATLTQEVEIICREFQDLRGYFKFPGQAMVIMNSNDIRPIELDMDQAWEKLPYIDKEELKWKWMQLVPGATTSSWQPAATSSAEYDDRPPPPCTAVASSNPSPSSPSNNRNPRPTARRRRFF